MNRIPRNLWLYSALGKHVIDMKNKILVTLLIIFPLLAGAQSISQSLQKPGKLFIGSPFTLNVKLTTTASDSIFAPRIDSLDVFFIKGEPKETVTIEEDKKITDIALTFQAFDTGEYTFPELEFLVQNGSEQKTLKTREFVVIINTVLADSASVIKDIAKPVDIKLGFWDYFIPLLALALLYFIIRFLAKLIKKDKSTDTEEEYVDPRSAQEIALEMLDKLEKENLLSKGEFIEFYYQLSLILRFFIEKHYRINALEMTTSEIRYSLKTSESREKSEILNLLTESDKVKFAKFIPQSDEAKTLFNWLKAYLIAFDQMSKEDDNA